MYAYCENNPVIAADYNGKWLNILIGAVVGAIVNTVVAVVEQKPLDEVLVSAACGALGGGLATAGLGCVGGAITSFVDSAYSNTREVIRGEKTIGEAITGTVVDTALGAAFGAMGSASSASIASSKQIFSAGWNGVKTLCQNVVHPTVKAAARDAVKVAGRYVAKTFVSDFVSSTVSAGISKGASWFSRKVYSNYSSVF